MFVLWLWNLDIGTINSCKLHDCVFPKNGSIRIFCQETLIIWWLALYQSQNPAVGWMQLLSVTWNPSFYHFHVRILIPLIYVRLPCKHMVQHPGFSKKKWKLMYLQRFWIMLEHCILDWEIWMKQRLVEICFFYSSLFFFWGNWLLYSFNPPLTFSTDPDKTRWM